MITKFLSSQFSGYLSLIGIAATLGLVWYIYNEGKEACVAQVITKTVEKEVRRNADEVRKEEQSLTDIKLDNELCDLGIVRQQRGCGQ